MTPELLSLSLLLLRKRRRHAPRKSRTSMLRNKKRRINMYLEILQRARDRVLSKRTPRRWWVRPVLQYHEVHGAWVTTIPIMREDDPERFYKTFRMTPRAFDELLHLVGPHLKKKSLRIPICPGERLAITLRFLATGNSFSSLETYFLESEETISNIVFETTTVIWHVLEPLVFKPLTEDAWLQSASEFEVMWNFPHCLGAIDGKHIRLQAPPRTGSRFFNYKDFFSMILLAVADAKRRFLVVDIGSSGRRGDGNVYHQSPFGKMLRENKIQVPPPCSVDGIEGPLPFFFLGDAAFGRGDHMLNPFKGKNLDPELKLFNYRLSRARGQVENTFGLMSKRYEVLGRSLRVSYACAKSVILSCCALHNYHMLDKDIPRERKRRPAHGQYAYYRREDGTVVYGRSKNENPVLEKKVFNRLKSEVAKTQEDTKNNVQEVPLKGEQIVDSLIDFFIDENLPWQWKSANLD